MFRSLLLHRLRLPFRPMYCATLCSKHCTTSGEFRNSRRFAAQLSWAHKNQEIRNPLGLGRDIQPLDVLFPVSLARPKTHEIRRPTPGFLISCVFGRNPYQIFNPPPIAFGRIPKLSPICCRSLKPVKAT